MADEVGEHFIVLETGPRGGGFGVVRKGVDRRDGSFVAVKFIGGHSDELNLMVFQRETRTLSKLAHKNIVPYRDSGIDETGTRYIVLDWVERNLDDLLEATGPWQTWDRLCSEIALPLVDALAYTHLQQIEHRDIKPKNVLITDSGIPMLADFGIAKIRGDEEDSTQTVATWHSRPYAPPEINSEVRYVRDVYSVGVLLIQCLSTTRLATWDDVDQAVESIDVPPEIRKILASCVARDPGERPRNASELLSALSAAQSRRVANAAPALPIWLRLHKSAIKTLTGDDSRWREATTLILADLSGEVHAHFRRDPQTGQPQRDTLFLIGETWRLVVKPDNDGAGVTAARKLEFEELERYRKRALLLPRTYDWVFDRPMNIEAARESIDTLVESLQDFHAEKAAQIEAGAVDREGDDLFDTWLRVLSAREDLARGEKKPLPYVKCHVRDREATFTLTDPVELDLMNTEWQITDQFEDRRHGWGEVVEHDGDRLTLRGTRWVGIPDRGVLKAHLGPDGVAISRQREAVLSVKNGTMSRPHLRQLLLTPDANQSPASIVVKDWNRDLDDRKQQAVVQAMGAPDIFLVQGPPGTGKTSFIAELVEQSLIANPDARILIASQTNVAVDNALEKLDEGGIANLVRLASADESRVSDSVRHLLLKAQMGRWSATVRRRAEGYLGGVAEAAGLTKSHLQAALVLQQLAETLNEIGLLQTHVLAVEAQDSDSTELVTALEPNESTSSAQDRIEALTDLRDELFEQAQSLLAGDLTLPLTMNAKDALSAVEILVGAGDEARALLSKLRLQGQWLLRMTSDDRLAATFLDQTSVIAGTCTGFLRHPAVRQLDIDVCIVDEASRATMTEALVPASRAKRWVFVGDTNQLPPTDEELLRSKDILKEHQLTPNDIEETLFQRLADRLPEHSKILLSQQYRMVRPIGDLISTCFYDDKLRSVREDGLAGYALGYGKPVMWVDTASLGEARRESAPQGNATSYANRGEVRVLIDRLRILNKAIEHKVVRPPEEGQPLDVLVIAPYVSQVRDLTVRIAPERDRLPHLSVSVMSVDAVQGRESDVALLSVTRSNAGGQLGFLGADYWRRINVALSRARFGLTIVGDAKFIKGTHGALRRVLNYIDSHPWDCEIRMAER